jgi:hypothetical protein
LPRDSHGVIATFELLLTRFIFRRKNPIRAAIVEHEFSQQNACHDLCHNKVELVSSTPKSDQSVAGSIER